MVSQSDSQHRDGKPPTLKLGSEFRMTKQRREVYEALMEQQNHPTAAEVFIRAKDRIPKISLATVYNCLETLNQCDLVKKVNLDRAPSRYCANLSEHGHFYCEGCGDVEDIVPTKKANFSRLWELPEGSVVDHFEVSVRGTCAACTQKAEIQNQS
jgi:Fe2+ or Zn2+ uptake regulation protein